jgi:hypothetical protein
MRQVRVHQNLLIEYPSAKLWYLGQAFDLMGSGKVELGYAELCLLKESLSTTYRWLKDGVRLGFFRSYRSENGVFTIYLGGLIPVCLTNKIDNWGAVGTVDITEVLEGRKTIGAKLATLDAQNRSRYAAKNSMKSRERKHNNLMPVDDIFALASVSSPTLLVNRGGNSAAGVIGISNGQLKVDGTFTPFGASQTYISAKIGRHPTTTRSYLEPVKRLQVVQAKDEYRHILSGINHNASYCESGDMAYFEVDDKTITLYERNGRSSASKPGGHRIDKGRFFEDSGQVFLRRCNLYQIDFHLESMRYTRSKYKELLKQAAENSKVGISP